MMCRILPSLLTALAAVALPQIAAAEPAGQGPQLPGPAPLLRRAGGGLQGARAPVWLRLDPKQLFERLDANQDGQVTSDEVPPGAPDRLKQLLKRADVNQDKQVSPDELAEALMELRQANRGGRLGWPGAMPGPPRAAAAEGFAPRARGGQFGPPGAMAGPRGFARRGREGWPGAADARGGRGRGPRRAATGEAGGARTAEKPQLEIYPITVADPESVLKVMQTLLAGDPNVRLAIDPKTGSLVVLALPSQHATIVRPILGQYERGARRAGPRLDPKQLFKRLDANQDGQVTSDEVPPGAPDRLKQLLKRADVNRDKQVSPDELAEAIKKLRQANRGRRLGRPGAVPGPPRAAAAEDFAPRARGGRRGPLDATTGPTRPRGPGYFAWRSWGVRPGLAGVGPGPRRPPRPPGAGPWNRPGLARGRSHPPTPVEPSYAGLRRRLGHARAVFSLLDTDHDQKLSLEEFTAGAMYLLRPRPPRSGPRGPAAGPPPAGVSRRPQAAPAGNKSDQAERQTPRTERRRPRPEPPE